MTDKLIKITERNGKIHEIKATQSIISDIYSGVYDLSPEGKISIIKEIEKALKG